MEFRVKCLYLCLFFVFAVSFAQAQLTITPTMLNFGDVEVGNYSTINVQLSATAAAVTVSSLATTGSANFSIPFPPTIPFTITAGSSMFVEVKFAPSAIAYYMGFLNITTGEGPEQVNLRGFGVEPTPMMVNLPYNHDFGYVPIGTGGTSINIDVRLTPEWIAMYETGIIESISATGAGFTLGTISNITTSSTVTFPLELSATDVLRVPIICNPSAAGYISGMFNVSCSSGESYSTQLSATGRIPAPHISISPNSVIMSVMEGSSGTSGLYVINTGEELLDFTIDDADFPPWLTLSQDTGTVNGGDSLLVSINADATSLAVDSYSCLCHINSNDALVPTTNLMITVEVTSLPLVADFSTGTLGGHPPFDVTFYSNCHSDPTQTWVTINSYKWDFNNDGVFDSFEPNPTYTYTTPGLYSVRLVIGTNTGLTASKLRTNYINATNSSPTVVYPLGTISMFEDIQWGPTSVVGIFNDSDGDAITISCQGSEHLSATVSSGYLKINPAPNWNGSEMIAIKGVDQFGKGGTDNVLVTVAAVNDAPILSVPADLYFIRNSVFTVDFAPYIDDPDNLDAQLSLTITPQPPLGNISFAYTPTNIANTVGQLTVAFSSLSQVATSSSFTITVNDNMGRLVATANFTMHVLEHFTPLLTIGATYQFAGQTVAFTDATLGNPDHWFWEFGDGGTSDQQNPQHQFLLPGTYDIRLSLGNSQVPAENAMVFIPAMIHLSGTAVTVDNIPDTWTVLDSPYNIYGDVVIDNTSTVEIEDDVVVNLFNEEPLHVLGSISANGVTFQPQTDSGKWGGLKFSGAGLREPSSLTNCRIIDATLPLDVTDQSPVLNNLYIAVSDTTFMADGEAIRINDSSCQISNTDIWNYREGITVEGQSRNRSTPTLTNIRVRNASNTQRVENEPTTGVTLKGTATVNDLEVVNCSTGILISSSSEMASSTPTLTNIRVRNSSNTQRSILTGIGIMITGNAAPHLTEVDISEVANGIVIDGVNPTLQDTPTLTNIRVRNASNTTRSITNGLIIRNTPQVQISDAWFDDFANGIVIEADSRTTSTPTLTNIRVRNASNTTRTETTGIKITGSVIASLNDVEIDDYYNGLNYSMIGSSRTTETVTLTNIRVRNASNTTRQLTNGAVFSGLGNLKITDMEIEDYGMGLTITAPDTRAESTPTLTNIRIRNASNTQRLENNGIFLGSGVLGSMKDSVVEGTNVGIMLAEGNRTVLTNNKIFNCTTGLRASGINPLPLSKQLFAVEEAYQTEHPGLDFCAFDLYGAGPWLVTQNTIYRYNKGVVANNAEVNIHTNILWSNGQALTPFVNNASTILNSYNDIYYTEGVYPGTGNINSDPMFMLPADRNYSLINNSPCIDAGNPALPTDADGSIADMGFFSYIHRAAATPSARFVIVGTQVNFTNTSWGHDYSDTQIEWNITNIIGIEGTARDFSYTFTSPGVYDLRLRMQSGSLIDEKVYPGMVVVSSSQLLAPANPALEKIGSNIVFSWDAVTHTVEGNPFNVPFYLVYKSDSPDGFYNYLTFINSPGTSYADPDAALSDKTFYIVLGFAGTRAELMNYIQTTPHISKPGARR